MKNNWKEDFDKRFASMYLIADERIIELNHNLLKGFITNLLAEQKKELMEEALARENILKDVHNLELDSISCKSLEEFMKWSNYRKNSKSLKHHE